MHTDQLNDMLGEDNEDDYFITRDLLRDTDAERKQAEKTLERTNRAILTVWESMTDAFVIVNNKWQFTYVNTQGTVLLQKSREELIGISLWDVFPEAVGTIFDREYRRAIAEQVSVGFEAFYPPLSKWMEIHAYPSLIGLSVYFRDVSDRKEAETDRIRVEQALRASEHRLRLMLESGQFGTFELDLIAGRYLEVSDIGRAQFALISDGEVLMMDFFERVHPDDRAEMEATVTRVAAAGETDFVTNYRIVLPNGSIQWISVHGTITYEDTGLPSLMLGVTQDITERKQAEDALRQAEQEQRQLAAHLEAERTRLAEAQAIAKIGSWEMDLQTRTATWSDEIYRIFGMDPARFVTSENVFLERVHPDDLDAVNKTFAEAVANRMPSEISHRIVMDDGSIKFVHDRYQIFYDDAGKPARSFGTTQDVTVNHLMVEALRRSEHEFRRIVETTHEGVVQVDAGARITYANQRYCEMLGYTAEELVGRSAFDLMDDESRVLAQQSFARRREGVTEQFDRCLRHKDGSVVWGIVSVTPVFDDAGKMIGSLSMTTDISERKQAEEERDRFFTLSLDMLAIIGSDGDIKRLNPAFEATLGFSNAELMAKPFLAFVHPDDITATLAEMARLRSGLQVVRFENRYLCRDGSYKWLQWTSAPYAELWYCVAHDITAIKKAETALQQANDELELRVAERTAQFENSHREMSIAKEEAERANAAKSEFLSRMSHELRTPLNSILGFAQIMEMDALEGKQALRLGHIIQSGQQLLQLINEVLDLARVESGRLQLSSESVCLGICVQTAVDMIQPLCEQRGQTIICNESGCEPVYVHADQQRLTQVLINLLTNATKYNRVGGVILVHCEQTREGWHQVSISDSGAGISPEQMAKLFQPYERLDADGSQIEGTGLGLALSKRLMDLMGGVISVTSVVGSGSTFVIELPQAESPLHEIGVVPSHPQTVAVTARQHIVLYIEDNLANLQVMEHIFTGHPGYRLRSAETGLIGLAMARELLPSLILLDLHLPDLPGDEVLHRLQTDPVTRSLPVVMVSADATPTQIQRLLASGATDYLTKPLDVQMFLDVVGKIVHRNDHEND